MNVAEIGGHFQQAAGNIPRRAEEVMMQTPGVTDEEIKLVGPILQRLVSSDHLTRKQIETYGVSVTHSNFYSTIPSIEDIESSFEYAEPNPPYLNRALFDDALMTEVLTRLDNFSSEFDPDLDGDELNGDRFFWKNSLFSYSDAMAYYCFIRELKPKSILEIGSGFSTLVALEAVRKNGSGNITCVEPFPRPFLRNSESINLREERAQDISVEYVNDMLKDGDILFIDSTHTVKTGSDCLHLYLRILPNIKSDIFVHVHDVFLPFGMPQAWLRDHQYFWTEQYLLLALMTDNPKVKVLYGSEYHYKFNTDALFKLMNNRYSCGGASFWFEYRGRTGVRS
jgi:hypothetical protein